MEGNPRVFDESAIHEVFLATGGIPRRINAICNRLMLAGFLAGHRTFTAAEVKHVVNEFTGEIGPRAIATSLPESAPVKRATKTDLASTVRRLVKLSDRIETLEHDIQELIGLVRSLVDPERARPGELARRERPRRRRKLESRA